MTSTALGLQTLNACQQAYDEVLSLGVKSSESIISCTELYNFPSDEIGAKFDIHGERLFDFLHHTQELVVKRHYAKSQIAFLGAPVLRAWSSFAKILKIGACDELSSLILTSKKIEGLQAFRIIVLGQPKASGTTDDHVVLAFSKEVISHERFRETCVAHKLDLLQSLHSIKDLVLVDAYLGRVIPSEDLLSDESYIAKLQAMKNTFIRKIEDVTDVCKSSPISDARIAAFEASLDMIKTIDVPPSKFTLPILTQKRAAFIHTHLKRLFADLNWKITKNESFWTRGDPAILAGPKARLEALGMTLKYGKIKDSEEFLLSFECKDYTSLEKTHKLLAATP